MKLKIKDWKEETAKKGYHSTTIGNVKVIDNFHIPQLKLKRRVWIYLPPDYEMSGKRYPTLYMHDGQNLFDEATSYVGEWKVDKILDYLFYKQHLEGVIVVGIDNGSEKRLSEYVPSKKGRQYAKFLAETLKPFIDEHFRTLPEREFTGVAGSSLGGLMSLYMAKYHAETFSKIGAFSPAMAFAKSDFKTIEKIDDMKIYMDVGTSENLPYMDAKKYADEVWNTYYAFICSGFNHDELKFIVEKDAPHNEEAWSMRFASAIHWLYN